MKAEALDRRSLMQRAFEVALYRFRMWQLERTEEVVDVADGDLVLAGALSGICLSIVSVPAAVPEQLLLRRAWRYGFETLRPSGPPSPDAILWAQMTEPVLAVAADSITTDDPRALVSYALTFWAHLSCHNGQSIDGPEDADAATRIQSDGTADHIARIVALQCYGYPVCEEPLDLDDPGVKAVLTGGAVPMFRERAARLGTAAAEHEQRGPRRAWRDLSARLIEAGLPADSACVLPGDGRVTVVIGGFMRTFYEGVSVSDAPAHGFGAYRQHIRQCGGPESERLRLEATLMRSRRLP